MTDPRFALLDAMHDHVFVLDAQRTVLFANRGAQARLGHGHVGRHFVQVIRNPKCLDLLDRVEGGEEAASAIVTLRNPVPGTFDIRASRFGEDTVVALLDISQQRAAAQMRSDFVANVSHELRSPLTALSGFIETLQGPAADDAEAQTRFLALMQDETRRMTNMIADLLSLSRVEERQAARPSGQADLAAVLQRARALIEQRAVDASKVIVLEGDAPPLLRGDEDELVQLFQNLLENAVKYSAPGTAIIVDVAQPVDVPGIEGKAVSVSVIDKGEGIAPQHVPRLTERFYRVDDHRGRKSGGTGLGLAIVKHVVQRHRGRLRVHSQPGNGSVFKVSLPLED